MPRVTEAYLENRRRQILDAALACFAREGLHRTTMQHIVREARLSPGALYRYFASKDDIIAAIAASRHGQEEAMIEDATRRPDARAGLQALAGMFLGRLESPIEQEWRRVTIQLWGEALRNPRVMEIAREGLSAPLAALTRLVRRAQRQGQVTRGVKPEAMARVAAAIFQGLVLQQAWDPGLDTVACARAVESLVPGDSGRRYRKKTRATRTKVGTSTPRL